MHHEILQEATDVGRRRDGKHAEVLSSVVDLKFSLARTVRSGESTDPGELYPFSFYSTNQSPISDVWGALKMDGMIALRKKDARMIQSPAMIPSGNLTVQLRLVMHTKLAIL